jgi:hypothetical protein
MWTYLILLLAPPAAAAASRLEGRGRTVAYVALGLLLTLFIGTRFQVGCDWNMYLLFFVRAQEASLAEALTINSPGYMLVNWAMAKTGLSIAGANSVCALILVSGLLAFSAGQRKAWLSILIALPVLIMLGGFSATRQGAAIGFLLWALHFHLRGRSIWAVAGALIAGATFHASLLVLLPAVALMRWGVPRRPAAILLLIGAASVAGAAFIALVPPFSDIASQLPVSKGAWFRAAPTLLALLSYPIVWRFGKASDRERSMLYWLAAFSLACLALGLVSPYATDRLGMYAIPFQMAALTRLAGLARPGVPALALSAAICAPFVLLFAGWLNLGATAACFIPYRSHLTEPHLLSGKGSATHYKFNNVTDPWDSIRPLVPEGRADDVRGPLPPKR